MIQVVVGNIVRVSTSPGFKNAAAVLTDPTTVKLKWGYFKTETTWVYGTDVEVVKDSAGLYHADIPIVSAGFHRFRWEGTGTVEAAQEGVFLAVTRFG